MISYLISDNTDTLVGMRLAGITGVVLKTREEALEEFNDCLNNKEIGILILTENIFNLIGNVQLVASECARIKKNCF